MSSIYISLGSNQGDRIRHLEDALQILQERDIRVVRKSPYYLSKAWGNQDQPDFINQVVEVATEYDASVLLSCLLATEREMGRVRTGKWQPRSIDLDLLFYHDEIFETPGIQVPHPRVQDRNFILTPMMDLKPDLVHPVLGKTIQELYLDCEDQLEVLMFELNG